MILLFFLHKIYCDFPVVLVSVITLDTLVKMYESKCLLDLAGINSS